MKRQLQSLAAIFCSVLLGLVVSASISGCQPPAAPQAKRPATTNSNTTDGDTKPNKPADKPKPTDKPAKPVDKPIKPTDKPANPLPVDPVDKPTDTPSPSADLHLPKENPVQAKGDWNQWGGNSIRNNVAVVDQATVPVDFFPGTFNRDDGLWKHDGRNIKWVVQLGSQTYGNTVVSGGKVYVGTNNGGGYLKRYSADVDLGCLIAFNESDGKFLWQHSSEKLPTGRVHDWPLMGICCSPLVEGDRVWFVTSRGEVKCVDAEGFYDNEDDGPVKNELAKLIDIQKSEDPAMDKVGPAVKELDEGKVPESLRKALAASGFVLPDDAAATAKAAGKSWIVNAEVDGSERELQIMLQGPRLVASKVITTADKEEADVVWSLDMMKKLGTSQHNMCSCSVTSWGDLLFVNTSNGVHDDHKSIPAPDAPSFVCMNKHTGEIYWTDNAPGGNILHGQWSSPTVAIIKGVPQVIFGGGDAWVYSYRADTWKDGKPELLWKFDINEKDALLELGPGGTKNDIIATPVVYDNKVYFATGQDPEHGEGKGTFWCIDPTKRGDISENLAINRAAPDKPLPIRRFLSVIAEDGEVAVPNPNSGVVWKLTQDDWNHDGEIQDFAENFHRSIGTCAIKDDLLFICDFAGQFFCIDAQTGKVHWGYDMLAASWSSPLIAGDKVYAGDEDGDIAIFNLSADPDKAMQKIKIKDDEDGKFEYWPINAKILEGETKPEVFNMTNSVYSSPIMANGVLFIANKDHLFAIQNQGDSPETKKEEASDAQEEK